MMFRFPYSFTASNLAQQPKTSAPRPVSHHCARRSEKQEEMDACTHSRSDHKFFCPVLCWDPQCKESSQSPQIGTSRRHSAPYWSIKRLSKLVMPMSGNGPDTPALYSGDFRYSSFIPGNWEQVPSVGSRNVFLPHVSLRCKDYIGTPAKGG